MIIRPDPDHPLGGYACIGIDAGAATGDTVGITLRNSFNDKYLGADGWQSEKAYFGPYALRPAGDRLEFIVGTEIVNQVEEYTALVIEIGGREFEVSWPDDIKQGPPAATVGGVHATPPKPGAAKGPTLVGKAKEEPKPEDPQGEDRKEEVPVPPPPPPPPRPAAPVTPKRSAPPAPETGGGRKWGLITGLVVLVLLAAAATFWVLTRDEERKLEALPFDTSEEAAETPAPAPCSVAGLAAVVSRGYGPVIEQLRVCGARISADAALGLLEQGVDAGDPAALAALGKLYDAGVTIDGVETTMGLTFQDNPARAAEYYSRAVNAGDGVGAAEALGQVCARLAEATDTLSRSARQDFCSQ
ncbi:SEL1-like repeat protein [Chachezhania sediminis]|uniref:hypothetical protein n=1 Tax=Chachezhania sediminis TaxID=2599291 RepID=UPI00131C3B1D|nr:hypothetical protein [Chachezhania sediminis]